MSVNYKNAQQVIKDYKNDYTIKEICKRNNISSGTIYKLLNKNKVKLDRKKKYHLNNNYFSTMDSHEKAYVLGFLFADGSNRVNVNTLQVFLHVRDIDILKKIKKELNANHPIHCYKYNYSQEKKGFENSETARLSINSMQLSQDLLKLGMTSNKTYSLSFPPQLPLKFINSFILGYYDGDGSLSINQKEYNRGQITITGTTEIIHKIHEIIKGNCNINCYLYARHKDRNNNNLTLSFCGNNQVMTFLNWAYKDSSIFLNRKHEKFTYLKEILTNREKIKLEKEKVKNKEIQKKINKRQKKEDLHKVIEKNVIKLYKSSFSIRQIGIQLKLDRRIIKKILQKNNIEIRNRKHYEEYRLLKLKEHYKPK